MPRLAFLPALLLGSAAMAQPPDFPAPKTFPPDAATLKRITDKTAELRKLVTKDTSPDVAIYLKAAEWIVKHGEWFTEKSAQQTLDVLDAGLKRAKDETVGLRPWLQMRGRSIACGYRSLVDGSIQPFAVRYPDKYIADKTYRADVILHGRDETLTEVKFLHAKESAKPGQPLDHFEIEIYGRGNNAYRWAGEADVFEVMRTVRERGAKVEWDVLRGFSMGGAGAWHIGLHHPFLFRVIGPGAGFTTTREYIGENKFGPQPDYIEKCLHIYDAVDYAENVFNVPVVAYSGEKDKQKLATDLIEAKLKDFKEPHRLTHLVAPGLEHKQPPEWMAKLEAEYQKHLKGPPSVPERVRLVTHTIKYPGLIPYQSSRLWVWPTELKKQYERAVIDATHKDGVVSVTTENVQGLVIVDERIGRVKRLTINGQQVELRPGWFGGEVRLLEGKWQVGEGRPERFPRPKRTRECGPIDDAFVTSFGVVPPTGEPWHEITTAFADARRAEFAKNWGKYFRGDLRIFKPDELVPRPGSPPDVPATAVLFGDPASNPAIDRMLPYLPIKWTKDELVVNGVKYDPKTHVPVLIYPNPRGNGGRYIVINSGHTFREADLKGTNALLYPRLGDWAVLKPKPTKDDPAGFEVVAAGLFDENWQFEKKK